MFFCKSYFDTVRENAARCLLFIGEHFLAFEVSLNKQHKDLVQMLRANLTLGWDESLSEPIRQCAEMERELCGFVFSDSQEFVRKTITVMLDEPSTRDALGRFMLKINATLPFQLINDYRLALASNSLTRAQLLKKILGTEV